MKKLIVALLLATSASAFAIDLPPSVPDAGSSSLLLLMAGTALVAVKNFRKQK